MSVDKSFSDLPFCPASNFVNSMLTDLFQITMAYAYFKSGRHNAPAVFDLFFRVSPFKGEFVIFAGLEEVLKFMNSFKFREADLKILKTQFPTWDLAFWDFLGQLDCHDVTLTAIPEGTVVFPREPLMRVEGPLGICQLLETTLLVLVNFASLIATNAARHRLAAGDKINLLEFGLRRAQGPDGAMSASHYALMGGFDGTSNVQAACLYGAEMKGTHAHAFVSAYCGDVDLPPAQRKLTDAAGHEYYLLEQARLCRAQLKKPQTNEGELVAFVAYAVAFPDAFLALVDTYDTLKSGVWNFLSVALALNKLGHCAVGIRLDSGDLAYLSKECRAAFKAVDDEFKLNGDFERMTIVASNDITEDVLRSLRGQGHSIDCFGIGTNLVTCKKQPALGCVYKLVEVRGGIKLSQDAVKITIPGRKSVYRLFNAEHQPLVDLMMDASDPEPEPHQTVQCRHPFEDSKRAPVTPSFVEPLHRIFWQAGKLQQKLPTLAELRKRVQSQVQSLRSDIVRSLNPARYKVSVSEALYKELHTLMEKEAPITELS